MRCWTEVRILNSTQVLCFLGLWPWAITCLSRKLFSHLWNVYNPMARLLWGLKMTIRIKSLAWCPAHHHENGSFCYICEVIAIDKIAHRLKSYPLSFVEKNRNFFFLCYYDQVFVFFFLKKDLWTDTWQKQCLLLDSFFLVILPPTCCFFFFPFFFLITKVRYLHSYQFVTEELGSY